MCERCDEIDEIIARYRRLTQQIPDQYFNDRAAQVVAELEAEKAALHPEK